jgi:hypothetical protein
MALHGGILVNEHPIGYWVATRIAERHDGVFTYRCEILQSPGTRMEFELEHQYDDGALALAAKVLREAAERAEW